MVITAWVVLAIVLAVSILLALAWKATGTRPSGERLARIEASPNYSKDDGFVNALPEKTDTWAAMRRWLFEGGDHKSPDAPVPTAHKTDLTQAPASGLRVTYLGHSSMLIEIDGKRVLTDPVWGERTSPLSFVGSKRFFAPPRTLAEVGPLDAIVISHDHYDHLDQGSIEALSAMGVPFVTPLGVGAHLEYWGVPAAQITELDWWQTHAIGDLQLACTPSRHFSGRFLNDRNRTLWASWAFIGPTHRAYFSGDTAMFPGFSEIGAKYGPFDVAMIEAGAYDKTWADVHLGPEQAVEAFRMVRGKLLVPVHWGTFDLAVHNWTEPVERISLAAEAAGVDLFVPKPGQSFEPTLKPRSERWWPEVPWQTAEQHPVVSSGL